MSQNNSTPPSDFIRDIIEEHFRSNRFDGRVATRFPPEPNGYLHIGHAKSVCLNFGIAVQYKGTCNMRMDDTDPVGETQEFVDSILRDVKWLGFGWEDRLYYASDYYNQLYRYAVELIRRGKAYVCSLSADETREYRGNLTEPGRESPYRNHSIEENLDLFERMRAGEFEEGAHVLRARIDMASPNMTMRDPVMYRIKKEPHYRTGSQWCIYPMYDFAHCLSDSIENITHSICTLEFENNRPLYDWYLDALELKSHPQQIEFARLNLSFTILSKRRLIELVEKGYVGGWNDPRMPTLAGMRRRGYTPEAIRNFCDRIGVAKNDSIVDVALLEHCVREDLNEKAPRVMAVLRPLKVIIDNYPEGKEEEFDCPYHPQNAGMGSRKVPFSRVIYIDREDFLEHPPKKFYRLAPGREVRLRYGYFVKCVNVVKDPATGEVREIHCTYDPGTRSGFAPDGRKVEATIHWVSAVHSLPAEVRLYDRLFQTANPLEEGPDITGFLNPKSLEVLRSCRVEPSLVNAAPGSRFQFERVGYFCTDSIDSSGGNLVFNRTVSLRDSWAKILEKAKK
ncbi:MAG: glutamine--tRNA ligase/YqeY domain fusion protein [Deltaproteobacteria bacterium]|nr:glutamine--tRNA ligase/YqeY domain fusion protein [Deltaproteobacteria bacterium]